jgi:hypothetical protein
VKNVEEKTRKKEKQKKRGFLAVRIRVGALVGIYQWE